MNRDRFFALYRHSTFGAKGGHSLQAFAKAVYYNGFLSSKEKRTGKPDPCVVDLNIVEQPIQAAWGYIGSDVVGNVEWNQAHGMPEYKLTNIMAIEVILDQDHITSSGVDTRAIFHTKDGKRRTMKKEDAQLAVEELKRAYERFGYDKVLAYLAKHIQLV